MQNVVKPRTVSFEDALRNLAAKLTGHPLSALPITQEGIVQYMAENIPSPADLAESVTQEVLARLAAGASAPEDTLDIVDGHISEKCLEKMTKENLNKLAADLGADVSGCKTKADFVAVLAKVEVQTNTITE